MARNSRKAAAELIEASTTSTSVSSMPFPSSNGDSTVNTPATSGEDEEGSNLQRKAVMRTTGIRRKRSAESDGGDLSISAKPATKRRAAMKAVYVEIPVWSANTSKDKGKGRAPSNIVDGLEDDFVPDSEACLELVGSQGESDDSGSEFEVAELDSEDEEERDITFCNRNGRKLSHKRKSSTAVRHFDDPEDEEQVLFEVALKTSIRDTNRGASTSAGSTSRSVSKRSVLATAAAAVEQYFAMEQGFGIDLGVVPDSEFEGSVLVLTSSEDEPIVQRGKTDLGKGSGRNKGQGKTEHDTDSTHHDYFSARREARRLSRPEKQQIRMLEYKHGRRLTHAEKSTIQLQKHHPELRDAWGDLEATIKIVEPQKAEQPSGLRVTLLPFQQESLYWMRNQEFSPYAGGLLADEMGMGKTIQMIALMVSGSAKPNLVVAPTVAVIQWRNEIEAHTTIGLDVLVWHGASRITDPKELKKYDVVLTTYAILESCFRKQQTGFKRKGTIIKEKSPLHAVEWERIVLDEAHNIKERATNTAKATFELKAKYRWCLSGTPLQNRVGELYSLIRFLGCDPFSYYYCKKCDCKSLHWKFSDKRSCDDCGHSPMMHTCFWNNEILTPIQKHGMQDSGAIAFKKLRILLDRIMLRRTKIQCADDLGLPPRTVIVRRDYFSPEEKELYLSLFSDAKREFSTYVDAGTLLNNYSNIFSLITRMRQMACHPDLVIRSKNNASMYGEEGEATVCRLCNDVAEDAIQAKCRHIFDRECIKQYLNASIEKHPACPVCHLALTIDLEAPALELEMPASARQGILGRLDIDTWRSSSKIEALVEELSNLRNQDATTKSIVFSQFVNFLDLIAFRLQRAGFSICRLEGTMSPQARDATIQHFMNNVHVTVFLVSLKAGGVALNLTEASRVYLMDSWWNPAVEFQAMDRIHRLGQRRPVQAIKLIVEDSIESRIVQLQEKKSAMVDATLSTDESAMGRLTPEDLSFLFRL